MAAKLTFEWSCRRDGNDGYVLEHVPGTSYRREFGPMPPNAVLAFAEGRRRLIAVKMAARGHDFLSEDTLDEILH